MVKIHIFPSLQGDSILLQAPDFWMVIDCNQNHNENIVLKYIRENSSDPKPKVHIILTHPHADHFRGLRDFLSETEVAGFYTSMNLRLINLLPVALLDQVFRYLIEQVSDHLQCGPRLSGENIDTIRQRIETAIEKEMERLDGKLLEPLLGDMRPHFQPNLSVGDHSFFHDVQFLGAPPGLTISIISPPAREIALYEDRLRENLTDDGKRILQNDYVPKLVRWALMMNDSPAPLPPLIQDLNLLSVGICLKYGKDTVILAGDMPPTIWNDIDKLSFVNDQWEKTSLLKTPHHGSRKGINPQVLEKMFNGVDQPHAIITNQTLKHMLPDLDVLNWLDERHCSIYCTGKSIYCIPQIHDFLKKPRTRSELKNHVKTIGLTDQECHGQITFRLTGHGVVPETPCRCNQAFQKITASNLLD